MRVAVVDSGIDGDHPMVGGVAQYVAIDRDDSTETGVCFIPGTHDDLYGHGTACAAIIRQVAPEVELVSVRVLRDDLKGSAAAFAFGVEWCIEEGVDIINLSMSTASERWADTFWDLVDLATYRGVVLVAAMNNERKRTIPSEFSGVFSVACAPGTDREGIWCNPQGPAEWGAAGIDVDVAWLNREPSAPPATRSPPRWWPGISRHPGDAPRHQAVAGEDRAGATGRERAVTVMRREEGAPTPPSVPLRRPVVTA